MNRQIVNPVISKRETQKNILKAAAAGLLVLSNPVEYSAAEPLFLAERGGETERMKRTNSRITKNRMIQGVPGKPGPAGWAGKKVPAGDILQIFKGLHEYPAKKVCQDTCLSVFCLNNS